MRYASKSNGSRIIETITQNAILPSVVLDQNDKPFVAYYQREDSGGYIAIAKRVENQWVTQKVEDIDDLVVNFTGARKIVDLEFFIGQFHIAFSNKRKVRYGVKEGDNWALHDAYLQSSEQNDFGQQTSLDFNQEGMPVITFYERDSEQEGGGSIHLLEAIQKDSSNTSEEFIRFTAKADNGEEIPNFSILAKDEFGNTIETLNGDDTFLLSDLNANVASLCARNTDNLKSSLSAIDLVRMSKMVINGTSPCKTDFIAADVNRSGEVSALDIIQTLNIIIGNSNHFVENESWRFYPSELDISNLTLDQIYENSCISIDEINTSNAIFFSGVKLGDIKCNP